MIIKPEEYFLLYANLNLGLWASNEVYSYSGIADILGVNPRKKEISEFEFKRSSYDLKVAERKKEKYTCQELKSQYHYKYRKMAKYSREVPKPHKFYFVMPLDLWVKEREYLKKDKYCGVIVWEIKSREIVKYCPGCRSKVVGERDIVEFKSVKKVRKRESNLQKFDVVLLDIASRIRNKQLQHLEDKIKEGLLLN